MRLTEVTYDSAMPVQGYGPGFFRIGGTVLRGPCCISPWSAGHWGGWEDTATPLALAGRIDVLFAGTGDAVMHVPAAFRAAIEAAGIGVEGMTSPAACRTYNVLLGEGRRVALVLMPVAAR